MSRGRGKFSTSQRPSGHERVIAAVKHSIAEGRYEGGMLPSYRQLIRELGVSMANVQRAMAELESEGLIRREGGRGTLVREQFPSAVSRKPLQCINIVTYSFALIPSFVEADYLDGYTDAMDEFGIPTRFVASHQLDSSLTRLCSPRFSTDAQGVVIVNSCPTELVEAVHRKGIPLVLQHFASYNKRGLPPHSSVYVNKSGGASQAVEHLLELGHRRIGFMGAIDLLEPSEPGCTLHNTVFEGYRASLICAGLDSAEDLYIHCAEKEGREAYRDAKELLERKDRPTAILVSGDDYAFVLLEAAHALNIRVPQDLSIVGFDNQTRSGKNNPPLTTVSVPRRELAKNAIGLLLEVARDPNASPQAHILDTHLIIRETTAPPQ